jgi:hypothetical protein
MLSLMAEFATTVLLDSYQLVNAMAKYDVIKTD